MSVTTVVWLRNGQVALMLCRGIWIVKRRLLETTAELIRAGRCRSAQIGKGGAGAFVADVARRHAT